MREVDLIIRTLRVHALDATLYDWYDPVQQRSTSPPPSTYLSNDVQLPYFERTVTLKVEKGKRLGLVIRGGAEYGLGIFISGVDKGSLSDQSGLCIGDQILSVNGIDFLHITHSDAVKLLRNINQMSFHLRQINKLPKPKDFVKPIIPKSSNRLKTNFIKWILDEKDQIKLKNLIKQYLEENILVSELIECLFTILNQQNQQFRVIIIILFDIFIFLIN
jgi:predicted metalloprotease with PDZ domain